MRNIKLTFFLLLIILFQELNAQTSDSIAGIYHRFTTYDNASGIGSSGTVITTPFGPTIETIYLDANKCAACVSENDGSSGFLWDNPNTYYGKWKVSNDTITITFTKYYAPNPTWVGSTPAYDPAGPKPPAVQDISPLIRKYMWLNGTLTPIFGDSGTAFLKNEDGNSTSIEENIPVS